MTFSTTIVATAAVTLVAAAAGPLMAQTALGGHLGVVQPVVTLAGGDLSGSFAPYTLGFPFGVTVRKSARFAFDAEFVPFVTFAGGPAEGGEGGEAGGPPLDPVTILIHPGLLFGLNDEFTLGTRLAYEVGPAGRYGLTPLLNWGVALGTQPVFLELDLPLRVGSGAGFSATAALHVGVGF